MGCQGCWCLRGKGQVKEMCLQMFLEGSNWNGWMDGQWQVVPKRRHTRVKSSCTCVVVDLRGWLSNSFAWSQWTGWEWLGKHGVKINGLFFLKGFVGQQTDVEQYSKSYWQPMKGMKQWNTASKWRWFHNMGQLILNMLMFGEVSVCNTWQKGIAIIKMARHKSICKWFCTIQIKVTASVLQIPHMVKSWAAHCWYMWVQGEILSNVTQRFQADFGGLVLTLKSSIET